MNARKTAKLENTTADISVVVDLLRAGKLVALPTETVYGLGADATNGQAVAQIYAAKGRPSFNPLIIHVADLEQAEKYAVFNDTARQFAQAFWPGPLTLVLPLRKDHGISELVTAGLDTIAIRVPAHKLAQDILQTFGKPIAAPSANISGRVSPTTPAHVLADLDGVIDAVIDGGACAVGLESSIVKIDGDDAALLRAGGVSLEALNSCLERDVRTPDDPDAPQSPGQLQSHYAPSAAVRLNATHKMDGEVLLGFGAQDAADINLSPKADLVEAAAKLFAALRDIDTLARTKGATTIAVSPIPATGLGLAINDRLNRASAPRD